MSEQINQYGFDTQKLLLSFMMSEADLFARSRNIIKDEYFDNKLRPAVRLIQDYSEQYKSLPKPEQVKAATGIEIDILTDITESHGTWYLDTIEQFCRYRAIENVILEGPELLQKNRGSEIETRLRDAMLISLTRDLGSDYFQDPMGRLDRLKDRSNIVSTGWPSLDDKLNGGFERGSLNIFCGGSGSGKSLWMQNLSLNWMLAGLNVIYITLELSQDLTDFRIDHMVSEMSRSEIFQNSYTAAAKITAKGRATKGSLTTRKFTEAGTTCNDIRAYLKEYQIQKGYKPNVILVDYLDLMYPNNGKVDAANLFVKDKFCSEELRSIAGDYNIPLVTASQLNRSAVETVEFDHSNIAGGLSKINTADNVFAILFTTAMRERGEYELQFLKTRSAASVGFKIKMDYNKSTLRITDPQDSSKDIVSTTNNIRPSDIGQEMKQKLYNIVVPVVEKSDLSSKIANLIGNIKAANDGAT